jgi:hypothetical protein
VLNRSMHSDFVLAAQEKNRQPVGLNLSVYYKEIKLTAVLHSSDSSMQSPLRIQVVINILHHITKLIN